MVGVDIFVPVLDKTYNFKLDEDVFVQVLLEEMVEMIGQKEQGEIYGSVHNTVLASVNTKSILSYNQTLKNSGVRTGDLLILV